MKSKILIFLLFVVPISAYANAGTPLMWAGMLHLLFGNLFVALVEGIMLSKIFKLPMTRCVIFLILANYISAWLGGVLINNVIRNLFDVHLDLYNTWFYFWSMVLVTFLLTLIIEWPFVAICFRGTEKWLKRSMKANLLVQSTTYILIFGWYWMASGTSLYTNMNIVKLSEISTPDDVQIIYISTHDGDVYSTSLQGKGSKKILTLKSQDRQDRLIVRKNSKDGNQCEVIAYLETDDSRKPNLVTVQELDGYLFAPDPRSILDPPQYVRSWMNFGKVPRLAEAVNSQWEFYSGFWAAEGLHGTNSQTKETIRFSFETPFISWYARNATQLPDDHVLFQLGEHQICIMEPATRKVALLAYGRGPVAIIKGKSQNSESDSQSTKKPSPTDK